jgi:carboxyl-terminal processing protease
MKRFKFLRCNHLGVAILASLTILLCLWFASPLLPTQANTQTQVFEQVWETVNKNFFDPRFNGVDWKAIALKYKPQAAKAKSNHEFADTINQMLSELRTSHTRFYTPEEPAYYQLMGIFQPRMADLPPAVKKLFPTGKFEYTDIGIFTKAINGKTFIRAILDDSPAAKAGLKIGDELLSVDGGTYEPIQSFVGKAGKKVTLLIQRTPNPNSRQEISVTPKIYDATTMFLEAQEASKQVIQRQGKKIAYVHIWSNAADANQEKLIEDLLFGRFQDADALVLDLRDGWGGGSISYLNFFTAEGAIITNIPRNGKRNTYRYQWKKPAIMLVNEGSRSSKEILAFAFREYKIGQLVGSQTAGAVVAGRPFFMPDGNMLYLAVADVLVNETERLERKGVTPDITVPFPLGYAQGADPQKQLALETVVTKVNSQQSRVTND